MRGRRAILGGLVVAAALVAAVALRRSRGLVSFDAGLPRAGQWRNGFVLADLNGDGHLDLAHGPVRKGARRPQLFLNDGRGRFHRWDAAQFPALPYDYGDAAVADFNGDGKADLALGVHLTGLLALLGDDRGHFVAANEGLPLGAFSSRTISAFGRPPRLAALSDGPRPGGQDAESPLGLRVYSLVEGRWAERPRPPEDDRFGDALAAADLDGDGRVDLAAGSNRFADRRVVELDRPEGPLRVELTGLPERALMRAVAAQDLDGDRRSEWVTASSVPTEGGIEVFLDLWRWREGPVGQRLARLSKAPEVLALAFGDLDADGAPDLVSGDAHGALVVYRGDGAGGFRAGLAIPAPEWRRACRSFGLALADLDGEPGDELVASFAGEDGAPGECPSQGGLDAFRWR